MSDTSITDELIDYINDEFGTLWKVDIVARVDNFIIMASKSNNAYPGAGYLEMVHMHCSNGPIPSCSLRVCDYGKCMLCEAEVPKEIVNLYSIMTL